MLAGMFPPCPFPAQLAALEAPLVAPAATTGAKTDRDAFGAWPHERGSANFVVKWGNSGGVEAGDADVVLDLFEAAWAVEIAEMGHRPPAGADTWRFNVYLADTGDGAPPSYGYAGYYTVDAEGWPMVVLNPNALAAGYAPTTSAHEFYHAVQHATGAYLDDPAADWWWEATAMWVEGEVWPDDADESAFTFGFGLAPQLPLWHFDRYTTGTLREYHAYGAFLFPRFLSEVVGDADTVTATWTEAGDLPTPQAYLASSLDLPETFASFMAHNARWDYADGDLYAANLDAYRDEFGDDPDEQEVAARLTGPGTAGGLMVHGGGYAQVDLVDPGAWTWTATVSPVAGAELLGTVVRDTPEGARYVPLVADGAGGLAASWTAGAGDGTTRVVLGTLTPADDAWSMTVALDAAPIADGDTGGMGDTGATPDAACGCASGVGAGLGWWSLLAAALTRRRGPRRAPSARSTQTR